MKIKAYDNKGTTFDRYTIIIGKDIYLMSHNPTSAQGVCMYSGNIHDIHITDSEVKVLDLPISVQLKINNLITNN